MIISSWNVNGLRAAARKGELKTWLDRSRADIACIQETKGSAEQFAFLDDQFPDYEKAYRAAQQKGYSGVSTWARGIGTHRFTEGLDGHDDPEGRALRLDFGAWTLLNIYFPNGGKSDDAWRYKLEFYEQILTYMNRLRKDGRRVLVVGDANVAHEEIDIARPKENDGKIGFHPKERAWVDRLLANGWSDAFRERHPDEVVYSYWHLISRARERNVGWRIDYLFCDEADLPAIGPIRYDTDQMGSDHCPLTFELDAERHAERENANRRRP